ncbi:MAG: rRNA maturation RNase YbeY [Planctomycetota bacterium]
MEPRLPRFDRRGLRSAFHATHAAFPSAPRNVSVALVGDASMAALHLQYSNVPGTTDVLSFDLRDTGGDGRFDAEIVISVEVAKKESAKRKRTIQQELELYLIHGLLHIVGFDDHAPSDRAKMRAAERKVLSKLSNPS